MTRAAAAAASPSREPRAVTLTITSHYWCPAGGVSDTQVPQSGTCKGVSSESVHYGWCWPSYVVRQRGEAAWFRGWCSIVDGWTRCRSCVGSDRDGRRTYRGRCGMSGWTASAASVNGHSGAKSHCGVAGSHRQDWPCPCTGLSDLEVRASEGPAGRGTILPADKARTVTLGASPHRPGHPTYNLCARRDGEARSELSGDESFYANTFQWFYDEHSKHEEVSERSRTIAMAWLDTPNARVAAMAIGFRRVPPDVLIEAARRRVLAQTVPSDWATPDDAEHDLRELLRSCFESQEWQSEA
jgi:hypothetical protein